MKSFCPLNIHSESTPLHLTHWPWSINRVFKWPVFCLYRPTCTTSYHCIIRPPKRFLICLCLFVSQMVFHQNYSKSLKHFVWQGHGTVFNHSIRLGWLSGISRGRKQNFISIFLHRVLLTDSHSKPGYMSQAVLFTVLRVVVIYIVYSYILVISNLIDLRAVT